MIKFKTNYCGFIIQSRFLFLKKPVKYIQQYIAKL